MEDVEIIASTALCLYSLYNYIKCVKAYEDNRIGNISSSVGNTSHRTTNIDTNHKKRRRPRTCWQNPVNSDRTLEGMENLFNERISDFNSWMSISDFELLLEKLEPLIKKESRLRIPIPPKIRLAITLRYLTTAESYRKLHLIFKVSEPSISKIVPEVCKAINIVLKDHMKLPETPEEWLAVEEGFSSKFPRCIGAIAAKRVVVKSTITSKYNGTHNLILMALIDSDSNFMFADVTLKGRISDGTIYQHSSLWQKIENGTINLPSDAPLPGRDVNVPYVFVGDGRLASHRNIMEPFLGNHYIGTAESTFNAKLSSTRSVVENAFGALQTVFKILNHPLEVQLERVPHYIKTCVLLHNFLRNSETSRNIYAPPGTLDSIVDGQRVEGRWRQNVPKFPGIKPVGHVARDTSSDCSRIRSEFAHYFYYSNS